MQEYSFRLWCLVLQANFPAILRLSIGMKDRALGTADAVRAAMSMIHDETKGVAKGQPVDAARTRLCLSAPTKDVEQAAERIQTSINVSVGVQKSLLAK